ncbi:nudix hydrolase 26, chloroplastic-like isoform X1 [Dioscorea cayenensis subsp. rotundata]|uniref:Nudix hydrolase 26, chloroplastic-like isoform X1 n=1 Tax=Dioscorea cayennensis subsp. rotundata TaxID=55577 RepID=A0AB40ASS8_DIOCR|nr:nudix hydrolase 26, chloroplastic-like isoform X1 [Dioscorea cayenensis subsp. rotundata]
MLSLCRLGLVHYPALHKRATSFPFYPSRSVKFTPLPLHKTSRIAAAVTVAIVAAGASMEASPPGYRRNVGICLVNASSKIFAASRLDIPGTWQMPQGGVDEGEDPRIAAVRELKEETGVTSAELLAEVPYWLTYDFPPEVCEKLNKRWGSNWKGQAQKWYLFRFTGEEEEINLAGDGSEKPEFEKWTWMTPEELLDHIVGFKKPVYEEVLKYFAPHLQSDPAPNI